MKTSTYVHAAVALLFSTSTTAAPEQDDLALLSSRRAIDLAEFPDPSRFDNVLSWVESQRGDGTWEDVNYASGCPARE